MYTNLDNLDSFFHIELQSLTHRLNKSAPFSSKKTNSSYSAANNNRKPTLLFAAAVNVGSIYSAESDLSIKLRGVDCIGY